MNVSEIKPYGALPSQRQINHFRKYSKKAFFHFGVNTFSNLEWGTGDETERLFNPTQTDVRQWIKTAKEAGSSLLTSGRATFNTSQTAEGKNDVIHIR